MVNVTMGGTPIRVQVVQKGAASGPRVLVLHGWGSSTALMQPLVDELASTCQVLALDFPGHGGSPVPTEPYGVPEHIEILEQVVAQAGWNEFGVVAHSNGGRVSLEWVAGGSSGYTVSWMALIAPSGVRRKRTASYYVKSWSARLLKAPFQILPGPVRDAGLDWLRHSLVWRLLGSSDYRSLEGPMRGTFVKTVNHYVEDRLPLVASPVLLLRGELDQAISADQVQRMAAALPDSGVFEIEGAGHYAHRDRSDIVLGAINIMMPHSVIEATS